MSGFMIGASPLKIAFSTEAVPERDRLEHWRELFAKAVAKLEWSPLATEGGLAQKATVHRVPGLGVVEGNRTSTGNRTCLTPELIAAADDNLALNILTAGQFAL